MPIEIRPSVVPERLGTPEAAEFEGYAALGFELERANWGHDHFAETAAELLGRHRNDLHRGTPCSAHGTAQRWSAVAGSAGSATNARRRWS